MYGFIGKLLRVDLTAGTLSEEALPEDVAQKLELALQPGKRTNGREKIGHMEIGSISKRIISVYKELLNEKRGRGIARLWFWQRNGRTE